MKCCVPSCNYSKNTFKSQNVMFHRFPVDTLRRMSWLSVLGLEDDQVASTAVVCSLHFNDANLYDGKNGARDLQGSTLPYIQVCMVCLDTHSRLYPLSEHNLEEAYHTITGLSLQAVDNFTPMFCVECTHRLIACSRFREKSIKAQALLWEAIRSNQLTVSHIETIRQSENLKSSLVTKSFQPDHYDLHIDHHEESPVDVELEDQEKKTIVKVENHNIEVFKTKIRFEAEDDIGINDSLSLAKDDIKNDDFDIFNDNDDFSNDDCNFANDDNKSEIGADDKEIKNDISGDEDDRKYDDSENDDNEHDKDYKSENDSDLELIHFGKAKNKKLNDKSKNDIKNTKKASSLTAKNCKNIKRSVAKKSVATKPKNNTQVAKTKSKTKSKVNTKRIYDKSYLSIFELTKLSLEEQVQEIVKRKESANYKNSSFQCNLCYKGFLCENTFARHMEKHTKTYGEVQCQVCKQHVKNKTVLSKHNQSHSTKYNCTQCEFVTMNSESARMHEKWHKGTKYKCPHCEDEFLKYTTYITHLRVKHPSDCICNQCGYSYLNQKGLDSHMNRIHRFNKVENPTGPWCEECSVRFASETAYHQHLRVSPKHHAPGTRQRNQAIPPRQYRKRPTPEYVSCELCGIKLNDFTLYMYHFKREHPGEYQTKHAPRPRECLCEQCGRSFQTPFHLKAHMAKHTGVKEYQCDVCDKRFYTKRYMDIHKQTHSATRRTYPCPVCAKTFTTQSSRNRHVLIHQEKSFKCDICDKAFSNTSERNSHVSHVHMKVPWPKRNRGASGKARRGKSEYNGDII